MWRQLFTEADTRVYNLTQRQCVLEHDRIHCVNWAKLQPTVENLGTLVARLEHLTGLIMAGRLAVSTGESDLLVSYLHRLRAVVASEQPAIRRAELEAVRAKIADHDASIAVHRTEEKRLLHELAQLERPADAEAPAPVAVVTSSPKKRSA